MNTYVAEAWAIELRSGKYPQGNHYLHQNDEYCCMGVLCEMAIAAGVEVKVELDPSDAVSTGAYTYNNKYGLPPIEVIKWAGLKSGSGSLPDSPNGSLVNMNDLGKPFEDIADAILEHQDQL